MEEESARIQARRSRPLSRTLEVSAVTAVFIMIAFAGFASVSQSRTSSGATSALSNAMLEPSWSAESDQTGANMGYSVASAGDMNRDGYVDILVGACNYSNDQLEEGAAFLYLGSPSGYPTSPSWTAEGGQPYAHFGFSVSSAGDVNHDLWGDVIIGAPHYDNGQADEGCAFLYLGSPTGLPSSPSVIVEINQAYAQFGYSVSCAGKVDNQGAPYGGEDYFDDVIIGAPHFRVSPTEERGCAIVYYGSASGLSLAIPVVLIGDQADSSFGYCVSSAGDVNNDLCDDVIVGAPYYDHDQIDEGRVFLYLGDPLGLDTFTQWVCEINVSDAHFGASLSSAGDVNNDGCDDIIIGAPCYGNGQIQEGAAFLYLGSSSLPLTSPSWTAEGNSAYGRFGMSLAHAGDTNRDGLVDVAIGAPGYGTTNAGAIFLYNGSSSEPFLLQSWSTEGDQGYSQFGYSVSSAGDVDNNGYDDVIVGSPYHDNGEKDEGRACLFADLCTPEPIQFDLNLVAGWNLISVPLVNHTYRASTLGLSPGDQMVQFDAATQTYKTFVAGLPLNDFSILPSWGYWIFASSAKTLTLTGMVATAQQIRSITVPTGGGWALVGLCFDNTTVRAPDLAGMWSGSSLTTVVTWNTATQTYTTHIIGLPMYNFLLVPGKGYWIYVTGSGTLSYWP